MEFSLDDGGGKLSTRPLQGCYTICTQGLVVSAADAVPFCGVRYVKLSGDTAQCSTGCGETVARSDTQHSSNTEQ
jgi:hypothetical protein